MKKNISFLSLETIDERTNKQKARSKKENDENQHQNRKPKQLSNSRHHFSTFLLRLLLKTAHTDTTVAIC